MLPFFALYYYALSRNKDASGGGIRLFTVLYFKVQLVVSSSQQYIVGELPALTHVLHTVLHIILRTSAK